MNRIRGVDEIVKFVETEIVNRRDREREKVYIFTKCVTEGVKC